MTFGRALALHITIGFDKICVLFEKQRSIAVSWDRSPEPCASTHLDTKHNCGQTAYIATVRLTDIV